MRKKLIISAVVIAAAALYFMIPSSMTPEEARKYEKIGIEHIKKGNNREAIRSLTVALKGLETSRIYYNRGVAYRRTGDLERAIEDFTKTLEFSPDSRFAYNNRAAVYREMGEYEKALADYTRLIELGEKNAGAWYNRAEIHRILGKSDKAAADYRRAAELGHEGAQDALRRLK